MLWGWGVPTSPWLPQASLLLPLPFYIFSTWQPEWPFQMANQVILVLWWKASTDAHLTRSNPCRPHSGPPALGPSYSPHLSPLARSSPASLLFILLIQGLTYLIPSAWSTSSSQMTGPPRPADLGSSVSCPVRPSQHPYVPSAAFLLPTNTLYIHFPNQLLLS